MKKTIGCVTILIVVLTGCLKEDIVPVVDFDIVKWNAGTPILTRETLTAVDGSKNVSSYLWDFGNGETSTEKEPSFDYPESGTYRVTLTVTSVDGVSVSGSKEIVVMDRVLKRMKLMFLYPEEMYVPNIENLTTLDVFMTIKQYRSIEGDNIDKLLFASDTVNLSAGDLPHVFEASEKVIIDPYFIATGTFLSFNVNVIVDGEVFVVCSNRWGGMGQYDDAEYPYSLIVGAQGGAFTVECDYE